MHVLHLFLKCVNDSKEKNLLGKIQKPLEITPQNSIIRNFSKFSKFDFFYMSFTPRKEKTFGLKPPEIYP